jgi:hypothetical protein
MQVIAQSVADPGETFMRTRCWLMMAALFSIAVLAACNDATPLYGPNSPRDGAGRPVDPVYGTPLPGAPLYGS